MAAWLSEKDPKTKNSTAANRSKRGAMDHPNSVGVEEHSHSLDGSMELEIHVHQDNTPTHTPSPANGKGGRASSRHRKKNFSAEEENLLLSIIAPYLSIIENKQNKSITRRSKNDAWKKIEDEFGTISVECKRTDVELRKWWDNHKTRHKPAGNLFRRRRVKIEGLTDELEADDSLKERVDFLADVCDSDSVLDASMNGDAQFQNLSISSAVSVLPDIDSLLTNRTNSTEKIVPFGLPLLTDRDVQVNTVPNNNFKGFLKRRRFLKPLTRIQQMSIKSFEMEKMDYLKHKRKHQERMLRLAEEQNDRAKIIFELDMKERQLKIELLRAQIMAAKKGTSSR